MPAKKKTESEISFEDAITRLGVIADTLENSAPSLEESLTLYEEGAGLLKRCSAMLDDAQKKITVLSKAEKSIGD